MLRTQRPDALITVTYTTRLRDIMASKWAHEGKTMVQGLSMGMALGAGLGFALGNFALGVSLGVALGAGLGAAWTKRRRSCGRGA